MTKIEQITWDKSRVTKMNAATLEMDYKVVSARNVELREALEAAYSDLDRATKQALDQDNRKIAAEDAWRKQTLRYDQLLADHQELERQYHKSLDNADKLARRFKKLEARPKHEDTLQARVLELQARLDEEGLATQRVQEAIAVMECENKRLKRRVNELIRGTKTRRIAA